MRHGGVQGLCQGVRGGVQEERAAADRRARRSAAAACARVGIEKMRLCFLFFLRAASQSVCFQCIGSCPVCRTGSSGLACKCGPAACRACARACEAARRKSVQQRIGVQGGVQQMLVPEFVLRKCCAFFFLRDGENGTLLFFFCVQSVCFLYR